MAALPMVLYLFFFALNEWKTWFPFVKDSKLLKIVDDNTALFHLQFSILGFTLDGVLLANITAYVDIDGSFEVTLVSPPRRYRGTWMGAEIPEKTAMIRFELDACRIKFYPKKGEKGVFIVTYQEKDIGFEKIYVIFFKQCYGRVASLIANMIPKFRGSAMEHTYNGGELTVLAEGFKRQATVLERFMAQP